MGCAESRPSSPSDMEFLMRRSLVPGGGVDVNETYCPPFRAETLYMNVIYIEIARISVEIIAWWGGRFCVTVDQTQGIRFRFRPIPWLPLLI